MGVRTPFRPAEGGNSPEPNRALLEKSGLERSERLHRSIAGLHESKPIYSAATTATNSQLAWFGISMLLLALALSISPAIVGITLTCAMIAFYTAVILFRGALLSDYGRLPTVPAHLSQLSRMSQTSELPIYSVMIALYKEAGQVAPLIASLNKIDWPKNRLDIKLVCEADDLETLKAIASNALPEHFELVCVPAAEPRTKPKALNYALPLCKGEFVVVYDAEDRPSPAQLKEAWAKFQCSGNGVAVLQAPLHIHNHRQNWITKMFAVEYATLFEGILPVLAKWKAPLPLGGSSNHFRTDVLREVGAWDPHNVTEDADLGIRLFRLGYTADVLIQPTGEEAPSSYWIWICQRTRWLKGWMQTILVHSREPLLFARQVGFRNAALFHLMLTSVIVSAMIHPLFLIITAWNLFNPEFYSNGGLSALIAGGSVFNLVGGYTTYAFLAYAVGRSIRRPIGARFAFYLPFYWLILSFAGWRALLQLIFNPHLWEKTPHGLANAKFEHK